MGLEDAMQRLGEDKFGRCVNCGEKIRWKNYHNAWCNKMC